MRNWLKFVNNNKRLLNFGFLFNFFSALGQTFFISLFVPYWIETFKITNASFGSIYAILTIISAFLISFFGRFIDKMPLSKFGQFIFSGLMISVIILSQAYNLVVLMIGLFLVRLFGQGLMTHTSSTGIAKYFTDQRGKALGFTALGHPAGQFILPLLIVPFIAFSGWRNSLLYIAAAAIVLVVPSLWAIKPVAKFESKTIDTKSKTNSNNINYFKSAKFWIISANIFVVPFICTAVFLYQYTIGQMKGWPASWIAFSFSFFAISSAISLLFSGSVVDRYTGLKLFPLYLIPALLALLLFSISGHKFIFPLFYALMGLSAGLGNTVKTAMQVEIYGTDNLGKIRSYFSTLLVLSTALGPPVFGFLIDYNFSFNAIMFAFGCVVLLIIGLSFKLLGKRSNLMV
ncbi:MAG: MFS transporter [Lutibacter sp.]|nr:MFS transporter [Lutibacter sp.]